MRCDLSKPATEEGPGPFFRPKAEATSPEGGRYVVGRLKLRPEEADDLAGSEAGLGATAREAASVNNFVVVEIDELEVRNIELAHRAEGLFDCLAAAAAVARAQLALNLPQRPQDAGPVESLPFTMLAVVHDLPSISQSRPRSVELTAVFTFTS